MATETTRTVLHMNFNNHEGKGVAIRLTDPKENLTAATVQEVMELILDLRVFKKITGFGPITPSAKGAKTVETITSDFGISID